MPAPSSLPSGADLLRHFDRADPVIAAVIRKLGPFQLKRNRNYFIVLCKAIIAQQISNRAAATISSRFFALFDGSLPTPDHVLAVPQDRLRAVGLSRQKASYLQDLSLHFRDKSINPHRLPYLDNETVIGQLTAVRGIGRWTAEMFLIFSLNRLDVFPVADAGLQSAIRNLYGLRKPPTLKKLRFIGKKWHPFETVATWYAWRTLDPEIVAY
ncbi:MAG: DNA-3-methyladenine glycosylase [Nitrospinae bacterium CG11_big_fil_rev_8_21_14_0_20_56_8]|nr:MAG: DNA-3-methyladenine glycosylase [Nitrospinae bacterium CG11_big_fil_rev_8_21_14_0_20_56_8]